MLDRIEIFGYRRLLRASAYVGRKTVALVGPNEAGKSSVLSALRLFDSDDPVPATEATRSLRGQTLDPARTVVRLSFSLTEEQQALARDLPIRAQELRHLVFSKSANGQRSYTFDPAPVLSDSVHKGLRKSWARLHKALFLAYEELPEDAESEFDESDLDAVAEYLDGSRSMPPDQVWDDVNAGVLKHLGKSEPLASQVAAFRQFHQWARPGADLAGLVYSGIDAGLPTFAQFEESLRSIRSEYLLSDKTINRDPALENLLALAGLPLGEIRRALGEPDYLHDLERRANERLARFFTDRWKQEQITVGLKVTDEHLRVDVRDLAEDGAGWIQITDRSDGLRTFVALAAFLESGKHDTPPILLIDEAEQHLHQNAQGDLIRMLQALTAVGQVLYTTHSPACLPADLGNGVRFVEPVEKGHSVIRHDFWSLDRNAHVGFNPLLVVMGAGAAAFSSLRSALIAEGVSDMLLLPTLIKLATSKTELEYQVSPGVATASKADMAKLDFAASRVAYLVDGDSAGALWMTQLEAADVPRSRIRSLPAGVGLEDLLDRDFYLDAVALVGGIDRGVLAGVPTGTPVKAAIDALNLRPKQPGPIVLAEFILGRHESGEAPIVLASERKKDLRALDAWVLRKVAGETA